MLKHSHLQTLELNQELIPLSAISFLSLRTKCSPSKDISAAMTKKDAASIGAMGFCYHYHLISLETKLFHSVTSRSPPQVRRIEKFMIKSSRYKNYFRYTSIIFTRTDVTFQNQSEVYFCFPKTDSRL